ncbi:MAG: hypothetical protein JW745_06285 [Sedimentisphaerales bacterium]|nr:hypothetical protein [Sedimentisphaerales bacterium]MBN2843958.1 hypothetical protein [Sedimentisphaerales bacterium]
MKSRFLKMVTFSLVALLANAALADIKEVKAKFINPPDSARPHTWWHWMNDNITREGITADLESMAQVGIGGAQIFNVSERIPVGQTGYMSPEWLEMVHHAVKEAKRLGIEICMHNCAGWSSSGGPWITPEYSMKMLAISETAISGPKTVSLTLPEPQARMDFYRDIIVIAFPTPQDSKYRLSNARAKAQFDYMYNLDIDENKAPQQAVIPSDSVVDITADMQSDGTLNWKCPAGDWTVLRIGYTTTGKTNHPAPDSGLGLECDKLSRAALDIHWQNGIEPILEKLGKLAGPVMNNLLVDSYEVGINNWTSGFDKEFARRRGYEMLKYLPTLTGRVVDSTDTSERFLWDYRRTISDLFTANYFGYFADRCHDAGLLCSTEPYDGPFECLSIASKADILMGEFWIGGGMNSSLRIASSVAHAYGRQIVGAESFTAAPDRGRWQNHPRSMKALGDEVWCNGINRYIFHRYAHQPWPDIFPGMTMGQWGTHFERTNTWWYEGAAWMEYIARSQYLLQAGKFHADVLFFGGETVPEGAVYHPELKEQGYDYDAIGTDLFAALTVVDGKVTLPSGMSYELLVMPARKTMSLAVAQKLEQLINDGAKVLATRPVQVPGLTGYPTTQNELLNVAAELWGSGTATQTDRTLGRGRLLSGFSVQQAMAKLDIMPDFENLTSESKTNFIHRIIEGADVYFVSNQDKESKAISCNFRVTGKMPQLWNSQTGAITPAVLWQAKPRQTEVTLPLGPHESVFVVFAEPIKGTADNIVALERAGGPLLPELNYPQVDLEIISAQYGVVNLSRSNMIDVSEKLNARIRDNSLSVMADNSLAGDPADGMVKGMLVEYIYDGKEYSVKLGENHRLELPPATLPAGKELRINKAVYGVLPRELVKLPEMKTVDVTDRIKAKVKDDYLEVWAGNDLAGSDPVPNVPKQLMIVYSINGDEKTTVCYENQLVRIPDLQWRPTPWLATVASLRGNYSLLTWDPGDYQLTRASGKKTVVNVATAATPLPLTGPWTVQFTNAPRPPKAIELAKLESLTANTDADVRAFSGTAVYQTSFELERSSFAANKRIMLDLGQVEVMARVLVNGKDLGVFWMDPYRIDITKAACKGVNTLEVRVTNQWVNRLIGDEFYPDDCQWNSQTISQWPQWLVQKQPRPSQQRQTFSTWKHWTKYDTMLPSGLIGPVYIRIGEYIPITD